MKISVTDFSAPIRASIFKLCVQLQVGKVYCVIEIKLLIFILSSIFKFSVFPSVTPIKYINMDIFSVKDYSATT